MKITHWHSRMSIRIYIFNLKTKQSKTTKQNKTNKQTKKRRRQKANETKEGKISVENLRGYDDIVCEFTLCSFDLLD